ncbi:MAG: transposase [Anaerolineae bacterium]|nr:transposase [Anaerolineae bacterium]
MGNYKKYSDEFKQEVLAMVATGERTVSQVERDLDITPGLIYKWQQRYRMVDEKLQPSAERSEQAELRGLKRELEIMRQERDILKKAIRVFSRGKCEPLPVYCSPSPRLSGTAFVRGTGCSCQRILRLGAA